MKKKDVHVLLVEDDAGDVELTKQALKSAKMLVELHVVPDGEAALSYLGRRAPYHDAVRPDVILLDLNLPKKDGRQVLREIKGDAAYRSIPVIILTTSGSDSDIDACYDLGANCYLTKPISFEQFVKVVQVIDDFWFSLVKLPPGGKGLQ